MNIQPDSNRNSAQPDPDAVARGRSHLLIALRLSRLTQHEQSVIVDILCTLTTAAELLDQPSGTAAEHPDAYRAGLLAVLDAYTRELGALGGER